MLEMLYKYIDSIESGKNFISIENIEEIEKQVLTKSTINVKYSFINEEGEEQIESKDVNVFEVMAFIFEKIDRIESKEECDRYDQR